MKQKISDQKSDNKNELELEVASLSRNDPLYPEIRQLYHDSFPDSERKPFEMIEKGVEQGIMEAWTISADGRLAGLAYVILGEPLNVLDYLAVHPSMRNHGTGAWILAWLDEHYGDKPIIVEIETTRDNEDEIAHRRKNFYLRNHFHDCGCDFNLFGVRMELMSTDHPVTFEEYYQVMNAYFGKEIGHYIHRL